MFAILADDAVLSSASVAVPLALALAYVARRVIDLVATKMDKITSEISGMRKQQEASIVLMTSFVGEMKRSNDLLSAHMADDDVHLCGEDRTILNSVKNTEGGPDF